MIVTNIYLVTDCVLSNSEAENLLNASNTQGSFGQRQEMSSQHSFQCNRCGKFYSSKDNLHRHEKRYCDQGKQFRCAKCKNPCKNRQSLLQHQKDDCEHEPRYKCPFCRKYSKQKCQIQMHLRLFHKTDPSGII